MRAGPCRTCFLLTQLTCGGQLKHRLPPTGRHGFLQWRPYCYDMMECDFQGCNKHVVVNICLPTILTTLACLSFTHTECMPCVTAHWPADLLGVIMSRLEEIQGLQQEAARRAAEGTSGMGLAAAVSATSGGLTSSQVGG
jgi:hypothetical protein